MRKLLMSLLLAMSFFTPSLAQQPSYFYEKTVGVWDVIGAHPNKGSIDFKQCIIRTKQTQGTFLFAMVMELNQTYVLVNSRQLSFPKPGNKQIAIGFFDKDAEVIQDGVAQAQIVSTTMISLEAMEPNFIRMLFDEKTKAIAFAVDEAVVIIELPDQSQLLAAL